MRLREALVAGVLLGILGFPVSSSACSTTGCLDNGIELRRDFVARVTHEGKPLPGVHVEITTLGNEENRVVFSGITGNDGTARVANLPAGKFDLDAELLG